MEGINMKLNETQMQIVEKYPIGSTVSRKEIKEAYAIFSQSETQTRFSSGHARAGKKMSLRQSRLRKGDKFYRYMIKNEHWKNHDNSR